MNCTEIDLLIGVPSIESTDSARNEFRKLFQTRHPDNTLLINNNQWKYQLIFVVPEKIGVNLGESRHRLENDILYTDVPHAYDVNWYIQLLLISHIPSYFQFKYFMKLEINTIPCLK